MRVSQRRQPSLWAMTHMQQLHGQNVHQSTDLALCGHYAQVGGTIGPSASARSKEARSLVYVNKLKPRYSASHDNTYNAT